MIQTTFFGPPTELGTFDEFDAILIQTLLADGRAGGRELSAAVGLSEATISRRCAMFATSGSFSLAAFVNPLQCGCGLMALVTLGYTGDPGVAGERIAAHPQVHRLSWASSGNCLTALVIGAEPSDLSGIIDAILASAPGTSHIATEMILAIHPGSDPVRKSAGQLPALVLRDSERQRNTDLRLLKLLQADMRSTYTAIAEGLGTSITLSGEHTKRMIASGALVPVGVYDHALLGGPLTAQVHITYGRNAEQHAKTLVASLPTNFVFLTASQRQVIAEVSVADTNALFAWVAKAEKLGDVRAISADPLFAIYKQTYDWSHPGAGPASAD